MGIAAIHKNVVSGPCHPFSYSHSTPPFLLFHFLPTTAEDQGVNGRNLNAGETEVCYMAGQFFYQPSA